MSETTSTPDLTSTTVGEQLHAPMVVFAKAKKENRNGGHRLELELRNETGSIRAVLFEGLDRWDSIEEGDPVMVTARVKDGYRGGPNELDILDAEPIEGPHPVVESLNPRYPGDVEDLDQRFESLLDRIRHPGLRRFLDRFFQVGCPMEDFREAPAAKKHHHAYLHGLYEHTIEVTEMAASLAEQPGIDEAVNRDVVIAGGLIHDAGKVLEYQWRQQPIDVRRDAQLYGHITSGPIQAVRTYERHRDELEEMGFTTEHLKHLIHIQVSHHGEREFGSPVPPATPAARCVQQADLASAKIRKMTELIREHEPDEHGHVQGERYGEHWAGILLDPPPVDGEERTTEPNDPLLPGSIAEQLAEGRVDRSASSPVDAPRPSRRR